MPRSVRHALVAALVALHAAVALGGAGLHALPGLGHGSGLRPPARNDHSHGPGKSSHEATDECPVCQFLAQGQLSAAAGAGPPAWAVAEPAAPAPPSAAPTPSNRLSAPRGPPFPIA